MKQSKIDGHLPHSQRQAKDKDKRFVQNWRPILFLNVDTKILSKSLAEKLKHALTLDIANYFATIDIEKAFDSVNLDFPLSVLKKLCFGENLIYWIKILLNDQQSCVINGGFTTSYFNLETCPRQGAPILAYLFILALVLVSLISLVYFRVMKSMTIIKQNIT